MRILDDKRKYILECQAGNGKGFLRELYRRYWANKIAAMSEGEIMKLYDNLTDKKGEA